MTLACVFCGADGPLMSVGVLDKDGCREASACADYAGCRSRIEGDQ